MLRKSLRTKLSAQCQTMRQAGACLITLLSLTLKEHVTYSFIDSNNGGGAGANPGAAPIFFHTHTLERRRRAQTGWPPTSIRGADLRSPNPDAGAQKLGRRGADTCVMIKQAGAQGREHGTNVPENMSNPAFQPFFHEEWALIPPK